MIDIAAAQANPALFSESTVWTVGEAGLECYYVFGLLAWNGTIFAFAEGRLERHDKSPHHIVLKTSRDGGASWGENRFVAVSRTGECFCNPTPLVERESGRIFLFYAQNFANERSGLFVISSNDDGRSWSPPRDLTAVFDEYRENWTLHLPGPGHGIQMRNGRLILPVWHRRSLALPAAARNYAVSVVFSDDLGGHWQAGGTVPGAAAQLNESRIVENSDGRLTINARSGAFVESPRYFSHSFDGGSSWSEAERIESLAPAFATDSGFINFRSGAREYFLMTRPAASGERKELTAFWSVDGGRSFAKRKTIYRGFAGYSDAAALGDGQIGVIYGRDLIDEDGDVEGNSKMTVFAKFKIEWLED